MSFLKKRLNNLIPSESARGALQNVLTVEWGTHKTVIIEVPQAGPSRSNEVEMYGMDTRADHGDYGRLLDDDDDDEDEHGQGSNRKDRRNKRRSQTYSAHTRDHHYHEPHSSRSVSQPLPPPLAPRPLPSRQMSGNPFDESNEVVDHSDMTPDHYDAYDGEFDPLANSGTIPSMPSTIVKTRPTRSFTEPAVRHHEMDPNDVNAHQANQRGFDNPWEGRQWDRSLDLFNENGLPSPISSKGTRDSASTNESNGNPFRQRMSQIGGPYHAQ
ncbi:hypothetical protein BD324DRAFT_616562 [Kockovaella imperatae]|uniref:Uncharacterized protein n=1 Tax=Kockovaella imperatae TaxID=4999 RepID=A0A1Y1URS9_9TREE|nr:hypothetical protein BD324DRAFT_616562 [Kockovaella imperatae]ORX40146.1 hypothetical protein BD324DRAFT_616562 [Kockovaella imperatae]